MKQCKIFISDIDNTLIGKPEATSSFLLSWRAIPPETRPILCYNTGRPLESAKSIVNMAGLPSPDYFICGLGTIIWDNHKNMLIHSYQRNLTKGWNKEKLEEIISHNPLIEKQFSATQNAFKSSWYYYNASLKDLEEITSQLSLAHLQVEVIYSNSRDLDILPNNVNKGSALAWLLKHLKISPKESLVAGDGIHDIPMFQISGIRGIVVENAEPELLQDQLGPDTFFARDVFAEGVLMGLVHYGIIAKVLTADANTITNDQFSPEIIKLFSGGVRSPLPKEQLLLIQEGYEKALEVIHKNITHLGFSACSLDDNEVLGTDENYRSVWSRDSAITLIGTIKLKDKKIRECQRQTLATLLSNISPHGQIPSYVKLDTHSPEFSGLGGICSVDSNLWVIIACYEYLKETGDFPLIKANMGKLISAINWLEALDSNRDGLLEIPEAGDWTDLFGRSYHVLYDEVLWYRANVCFGLLLEMLHKYEDASRFFEKAHNIKASILHKFWPTSSPSASSPGFADSQYSIGDARYLIAEVTPFNFNWRCDVYGNILAVLFNILDPRRSKRMLRFLWGVGVNEPLPVRNLYPPVESGADDWKSYYIVNTSNLPNHYHNGGIWPFIGGFWVLFIHHLGLRDVAMQELYRLALINKKGVSNEWEFNEWCHGLTGRPMGKVYQAWSAALYIQACQSLNMKNV